jgi:cytochrome c oxidase cbb3-type subunit I/II
MMMNVRVVALGAGVFFISLAAFVQGLLPFLHPQSRTTDVTRVVRTDLGELKWLHYDATDYTELEQRGRQIYILEGCWYCHSQYVRPVTGETRRWGPVSQAGEYAFDVPHLFSTRRIGPDLTRVGLKYSDEWHIAHFWNPRMVVRDSIMPRYVGLFDVPKERVRIVTDDAGNRTLEQTGITQAIFDFGKKGSRNPDLDHLRLTPNADGLLFIPERGKYPIIFTPNDEFTGETVQLAVMTRDLEAVIAYLQKLGTSRGNWRDLFEPQRLEPSLVAFPRSEEWIGYGKEVYERRCVGCHGVKGDGNGPASTFMHKFRPRNFQLGVFKFRLVSGPLPTDGDLMRTITRGVRGTGMPTWHELPEKDRLAVIQYIKFELTVDRTDPRRPIAYFVEEPPGEPLYIGTPPPASQQLLARGKDVWREAKCWECHGDAGKGDGEKAPGLKDDLKFPIRPADLTTGQFKSGPGVEDIFRTMTTGFAGTPMPSYKDSLSEQDRWALAYHVLALSAFKDPLTGAPLRITEADRQALNDLALQAPTSAKAYVLKGDGPRHAESAGASYAGAAWARRHGLEVLPPAAASAPGVPAPPR